MCTHPSCIWFFPVLVICLNYLALISSVRRVCDILDSFTMLSSCKNPNDFSLDINDVHITVQTHSDIIPILSKGLCVWPTHRRPVKTLLLFVFVFCSSFFLNFCEQLIHALTLNGFDSDTMTVIDGEGSFLTCSDLLSSSKHSLLVLSYWTVSLSPTWLLRQWPPAAWCQICRTTSFRLLTVIFLTDTDFKSDFVDLWAYWHDCVRHPFLCV